VGKTANLAGVCLISFAFSVTIASAQTEQTKPSAGVPSQGGAMEPAPSKPAGSHLPTGPVRLNKALTKDECTKLGGTLKDAPVGLCNSGQYCETQDENKNTHRVCISAAAR
jgi:hypothetical protein